MGGASEPVWFGADGTPGEGAAGDDSIMRVVADDAIDRIHLCDPPCRTVVLRRSAGYLVVRCRKSPGEAGVMAALARLDLRGRRAQATCALEITSTRVMLVDSQQRVPLELMIGRWTVRSFEIRPAAHLILHVHQVLPARPPRLPPVAPDAGLDPEAR
jgi:hypothetical protein